MNRLSRKIRSLLRNRAGRRDTGGVRSESMEKRILFSADVPWADPLVTVMPDHNRQAEAVAKHDIAEVAVATQRALVAADQRVVDRWQLNGSDTIARFKAAGVRVDILGTDADAIAQIGDTLRQQQEIAQVHLFAASVNDLPALGTLHFDTNTVLNRASDIAQWRQELTGDATIQIHVDRQPDAERWAPAHDALGALTGATIKIQAPSDPTGVAVSINDNSDPIVTSPTKSGVNTTDVRRFNGSVQVITVTNTLDTVNGDTSSIAALTASQGGDGVSLREAILALNEPTNGTGPHRIEFNLVGTGPHTIALSSALPAIEQPVIIDATTEPDFSGTPMVVLDGTTFGGNGSGLVLAAGSGGSEVRGLVINQFNDASIHIQAGSNGNTIAGNYLGTDAAASTGFGAAQQILIESDNNVVGGATAADRNIVAAGSVGIRIDGGDGNQVAGNYFGSDATGSAVLGTLFDGINIENGANGNTIGGATAAEGNVFLGVAFEAVQIAANGGDDTVIQHNAIGLGADGTTVSGGTSDSVLVLAGNARTQILDNTIVDAARYAVQIDGNSTQTVIQGNLIGTDSTLTQQWGSGSSGILVTGSATQTQIGGIGAGEGNVIANNGRSDPTASGVELGGGVLQTTIRGNRIFGNAGIGIDFDGNGQNANDVDGGTPTNTDIDTGPNNLQNYAELVAAGVNGSGNFAYQIDTDTLTSGETYTLDFYATADPGSGAAQGQRYLGTVTGISGSTGDLVGSMLGVSLSQGETITLLTTDSSGNTSEFSNSVVAYSTPPYDLRVAQSTDGGLELNTNGGNNAYLIANDGDALLGGLTSFTAEIQFSTTNLFATGAIWDSSLLSYAGATTSANDLLIQVRESGDLIIGVRSVFVTSTAMDYRLLADGQSHTLALTWDATAGDWSVVIDGQLVDSGTGLAAGLALGTGGELVLGQDQDTLGGGFDPRQAFGGTVENLRLYDNARTVDELAASHGTQLDYDAANLIAQWHFDALSSDGVVVDDVSGNNLTLERVAGPGFLEGTNELVLRVNEHAPAGTVVGTVSAQDDGRVARINALLMADPNLLYDAQTNTFYRLSDTTATYSASLTNAATTSLNGVAGELATVRSAYENNLLVQIAGGSGAYLGGGDSTQEGVWRWQDGGSDGEIFWIGDANGYAPGGAYTNWALGQPDNFGSGQDVLFLNAAGQWDDIPGVSSQLSIVAWDADDVLDASHDLTYAITAQTVASAFVVDADTGRITVNDPTALDFEGPGPFQITVQATDHQGYDAERTFTVILEDINETGEPPVDLTSGLELNRDGGNDAYLTTSDGGELLGGLAALTFETRVQIDAIDARTPLISYATSANANAFLVEIRPDGELWTLFGAENVQFNAANYADTLVGTGEVHSVAVTWDSGTGRVDLFIDGQLAESQTASTSLLSGGPGDGVIVFGNEQDSPGGGFTAAESFQGTLYDVRLWDNARTAEQIAQNANRALAVSTADAAAIGLLANWQMDGFNGSDEVVDAVGGVNLSRGQAVGADFRPGTIVGDLLVAENSADGTLVGAVTASAAPVLDDVVADGQFFNAPPPGGIQNYVAGQTVGDWQVTDGEIDLKDTWESPPNGGYVVDLNGDAAGALAQTLRTVPGRTYQLIFNVSGNYDLAGTMRDFRVSVGDQRIDMQHTEPAGWSNSNLLWETRTVTFVATTDRTTLEIASLTPGPAGALIGDVRVLEVPQVVSAILAADSTLSYDAYTDKFYRFVATPTDALTAGTNANAAQINSVDGQLATIRSQYENDLIQSLVGGATTNLYLGGTDAAVEGTWRWIEDAAPADTFWVGDYSGTAPAGAYANWFVGEPDSGGGATNEDYLAFNVANGQWFDVDGTPGYGYVIEWDASEVVSRYTYSIDAQTRAGAFAIDAQTGQLRVADGGELNHEATPTLDVTVRVEDAAGGVYTETVTITITDAAEAQVNVPGPQSIPENGDLVFNGATAVSVSDSLPGTDALMQVTLSVDNGTLALAGTTGLVIVDGTDGSQRMVLQGTESDLNAALDGLRFTPIANTSGAVALTVDASLIGDLTARYAFDDGTADSTGIGNGNDGALIGDASIVTDAQRGDVLSLDGDGDYVEIAGLIGEPTSFTLAGWIDATSVDTLGAVVISLGSSPALYLEPDGSLTGYFETDGGPVFLTSSQSLTATGWRHVAMTFDATTRVFTLYVDGVAVDSTISSDPPDYDQNPNTFIGRSGDGLGGYDFAGRIDDARIYARALNGDDVAAVATGSDATAASVAIAVQATNDAPTFAVGDGNTVSPLATQADGAVDVAILSDGRYLVLSGVNTATTGQDIDFALTRYNADGTVDSSFGTDGTVITAVNGNNEAAHALAVQDDGRIVVVGSYTPTASTDSIVLRYNADGTLDNTFDGDGMAMFSLSATSSDVLRDVAIDSNGNIVATGYGSVSGDERAYVIRLTTNGSLDSGFASGGVFEYATAGEDVRANALALTSDGGITIAGSETRAGVTDAFVLRLLDNGMPDASLNGSGVATLVFSGANGSANALAIDGQGRIVLAGTTDLSGSGDTYVWRLEADGSPDATFGSSGTGIALVAAGSPFEGVSDVAIQSDGRIVVVGNAYNGSNNDISVIRFTQSGQLDTTFDGDGLVRTALGTGTDAGRAVAIAPNGQLIVVGNTTSAVYGDSVILRYNPDGSLDRTFSPTNSLDATPAFVEDGAAVVLDSDVAIFDAELSALDNFDGATLTLQRNTGPNADDVFDGTGLLATLTEGGALIYNGVTAGTVTTNSGGLLVLSFNANATNDVVNSVMRRITYANVSDQPPGSVALDWTFNDGNASAQGSGGARDTTESITVTITAVNDAPVVTPRSTAYLVSEQVPLALHGTGFSVADPDDNGGVLIATFTVGEGRLLLDVGDSGVTIVSGNGTGAVNVTGTAAQLNALIGGTSLGTMVFLHDQTVASDTPSASTTFTMTVNDGGNSGADPGLTGDGASEEGFASQTITLFALNDAPEFRGPNLIVNGDFASGDLTGWSTTGTANYNSGRLHFGEGNTVGPHTAFQTIATQAGQSYTLEFDYRDGRSDANQQLQVTVDGASNLLTTTQIVTDIGGTSWVRYRFTFTADSASTTITFTDTSDDPGALSNNTNTVDGQLDSVAVHQTSGPIETAAFTEGGGATTLASGMTVFDAEINATLDSFDGTSLSLARSGGANTDDVFSAAGDLVFNAGTIELLGSNIGTVTNSGGQLTLTFAAGVTNGQINEVIRSIAYSNTSVAPPASVTIGWSFDDNNGGAQGLGGPLQASAETLVTITPVESPPSIDLDADDSTSTGSDFASTWFAGGGPTAAVDSDAVVSDIDSATLDSITLTLTNRPDGSAEVLAVDTTGTSITAIYDNLSGTLTLSGTATVAEYQQVLRTVTYDNTAGVPQIGARTIEVVANDGTQVSATATSTITVANQGILVVTNLSDSVNGDTSSINALISSQGGDGISLREAILASNNSANGSGGPDTIRFDLVGAGPHVISLSAALPDITDTIVIDGTSEPDFSGTPMVILDGNDVAGNGLTLVSGADNSEIRGLIIRNFGGHGIAVQSGADNVTIAGNYVGRLNDSGADAGAGIGNGQHGIFVGANGATIGGLTPADRNVVSGNASSGISVSNAIGIQILGNTIGLDAAGSSVLGNGDHGIHVGAGADSITVGGTTAAAGNIVSGNVNDGIVVDAAMNVLIQGNVVGLDASGSIALGNGDDGVTIRGGSTGVTVGGSLAGRNVVSGNVGSGVVLASVGTTGNEISANLIGTDMAGTQALGNGVNGISVLAGVAGNVIGGIGLGNIVSGNVDDGIDISGASDIDILGNIVGLDASGTAALGNGDDGLFVENGAASIRIGGASAGQGNVISANGDDGIDVRASTLVTIEGNIVGLDVSGTLARGNLDIGIAIQNATTGTVVGGSAAARNVVSANGDDGISLLDAATSGNVVAGNYVGTDITGTVAHGNVDSGIVVAGDASGNTIGGTAADAGNLVSGNGDDGIFLGTTSDNLVQGNVIGLDATGTVALGNAGNGIGLSASANNNQLGGIAVGAGNTIAHSGLAGIASTADPGTRNGFLGNLIFDNTGLAIDLGGDGVTPNDSPDVDSGPNELLNFPTLNAVNSVGGDTVILGALEAEASATYRVEFFSAPAGNAAGHGDATTYLGFVTVTTDSGGRGEIVTTLTGIAVTAGHVVTATATEDLGGGNFGATSELSANRAATSAAPGITVTPPPGGVVTSESGTSADVSFILDAPPVNDVTLSLSLTDGTEGTLSTTTLAFTTDNWNVAQVVTVSGVDDGANDGDVMHTLLTTSVSSSDPRFDGIAVANVTITNLDNDPRVDLDTDDSTTSGIDYAASWTEDSGPVAVVDSDASVTTPDGSNITGLTATITNLQDGAAERLTADTTGTAIAAAYDTATGTLTLTGTESAAAYQQVLRTLAYDNVADAPGPAARQIVIAAATSAASSPVATSTVSITPTNDAPTLLTNALEVTEGGATVIDGSALLATDPDNADSTLTFAVSAVVAGRFELATDPGMAVTAFTQADVIAGVVRFVHDGSETAPSYMVSVQDGALASAPSPAAITFTSVNDVPTLVNARLNVTEGQRVILDASDLLAADVDSSTAALVYTVTNVQAGFFDIDGSTGLPVTTFTQAQVDSGLVRFNHDGSETAPAFDVRVSDGSLSDGPRAAAITFNTVNDAPEFLNNALTLTRGDTVVLTPSDLAATDADAPAGSLVFTVSDVVAGQFERTSGRGVAVTQFSDSDISGGEIVFVHDNSATAPAYRVAVSDDTVTRAPQAALVTFSLGNLAPEFGAISLTVAENQLDAGRVQATDPDGDAVSLTIVGGSDQGRFDLTDSGSLALAATQDYENPDDADGDGIYELTVQADDGNGGVTRSDLSVRLVDVNESPTIANMDITLIDRRVQSVIAQLSALDPDTGEQLQYSLVPSANVDSPFNIDEQSGELSSELLTFLPGEYQFDVRVTDAQGLNAQATVRITVVDSQAQSPLLPLPSGTGPQVPLPATPFAPDTVANPGPLHTAPNLPATTTDTPTGTSDSPSANDSATPQTRETLLTPADSTASSGPPDFVSGVSIPDSLIPPGLRPVEFSDSLEALTARNRVSVADASASSLMITIERLLSEFETDRADDLRELFDSLAVAVPPDLMKTLDQMVSDGLSRDAQIELRVAGAVVGTLSLSAGFVIWVLRAGSLLGSFLASRPLWTSLDPLPIFWADDDERHDTYTP